jgi:hypothetical protein
LKNHYTLRSIFHLQNFSGKYMLKEESC